VTSTASHYGFIYTIFGLGASHMGLRAGPEEKACPARPMGSSLRPNNCDHCTRLYAVLAPPGIGNGLSGANGQHQSFSYNSIPGY
jgi:hypothetical protein